MKGTIVSDLDWKTHTVLFLWGLKKFACLDEKRFALLTYVQYSCSCTQICTCSNQKIHNSVKHTVCTQPVKWTNTDTWTCLMCASDSFSVLRNLRFQALLVYWPPSKAPPLSTSAALLLFLLSAYNTQTSSGHWPSLCVCVCGGLSERPVVLLLTDLHSGSGPDLFVSGWDMLTWSILLKFDGFWRGLRSFGSRRC